MKTKSKKEKAILFDLDNTLIDTHPILKKYLTKITKKYTKLTVKQEHKLETEDMDQIKEWLKKQGIKVKPWKIIIYLIHFVFTDINKIKPFIGTKKLLKELSDKTKLGIITNGPSIYTKKVLKINNLTKYFQTIQTTTNNKAKPNSGMIFKAARKLSVKTTQCIVVDDGKAGIIAGTNAGCTTIYFSKKTDIKADYYAKNIKELRELLIKLKK